MEETFRLSRGDEHFGHQSGTQRAGSVGILGHLLPNDKSWSPASPFLEACAQGLFRFIESRERSEEVVAPMWEARSARQSATATLAMLCLCGVLAGLASPVSGESAKSAYDIGIGDVLTVTVLGHPELGSEVLVTEDGSIQLPIVGEVRVEGLTLRAVTAAVTVGLEQRLIAPEVTVAVKQAHPRSIFVLGAVAHPGVYERPLGWRVTEALAAAGGLVPRPEDAEASLMRAGDPPLALDLVALLRDSNTGANVPLRAGDVLSCAARTNRVSVAGSVLRPGVYDLASGGSVVEALALAGGCSPQADLSRVKVVHRNGIGDSFDLVPVMMEGQAPPVKALQAGDQVIVPQATASVAVLGAVKNAGYFSLEPGVPLRVADAVARAGGLTDRPEMIVGSVFRRGGQVVHLQITDIFLEGRQQADLSLEGG